MNREFYYLNIDKIDYKEAWDIQKEVFELRYKKEIPDVLFLLEHPNTYTLGKTANSENLVGSKDFLEEKEISVYNIDRGGDITYHGPGQIVGYPIINLEEWEKDTHKYLRALEEVIINVCKEYGLNPGRNSAYTGVWIENRKIAAIGIKVSRWITMHGFAFNVNTDLSLFKGIIPCGIVEEDKDVTSLEKELGYKLDIQEVKKLLVKEFINVFGYNSLIEKDIRHLINMYSNI